MYTCILNNHTHYIGGDTNTTIDIWIVISIEIVIMVVLVTCLIGVHICHLRLKKKLRWIKEIAERMVGVHENEAYGSFQRQHTNVNVNRGRDTLEQTSNTPSPEQTYDTVDRTVSQAITVDNIHSDLVQLPNTETIENQSEDNDIQHEYQYIDIARLGMLGDRDEELELEVNDAYGLSRSVQRTHARTRAEHHDQRELVYENVLL